MGSLQEHESVTCISVQSEPGTGTAMRRGTPSGGAGVLGAGVVVVGAGSDVDGGGDGSSVGC